MTSFRDTLLKKLETEGVTEDLIAEKLGQVIRGESTKKVYFMDDEGNERLIKREVISRPKDVAVGVILYDALRGGELGLAPRVTSTGDSRNELHRKFAPTLQPQVVTVPDVLVRAARVEDEDPEDDNGTF